MELALNSDSPNPHLPSTWDYSMSHCTPPLMHVSSDIIEDAQQMPANLNFLMVIKYLWLFADGLHKNIITIRMSEKRKLQNASSTQSSIQS